MIGGAEMRDERASPFEGGTVRSARRLSVEAAAVVTALEAEGVETTTTGTYTSAFQAEAPGSVQVVVRQSQADKALAIIEKFEAEEHGTADPGLGGSVGTGVGTD